MNKILHLIIGVLAFTYVNAQNSAGKSDDAARIVIKAFVPKDVGNLTSTAQKALKMRLDRIVTGNGIGGSSYDNRFVMVAKIVELTKDVSVTTPIIYSYTLEITLIVGDAIEGTIFSSYSFEQRGAGNSETKAYLQAIKGIKSKSSKYTEFLDEAKTKIMEYYNSKCDFLQKEALSKADKKEYDEAIATLLTVPEVSKECYMSCQDLTIKIYKMKIENECIENIQKATVAKTNNNWDEAASYLVNILPDVSCYEDAQKILKEIEDHQCAVALGKAQGAWASLNAEDAAYWLGEISADSKCSQESIALGNEIKEKMKENENKEWDYKLKVQQDEVDITKARVKAARDIGVAYGKNQPKTVTYNYRGWYY